MIESTGGFAADYQLLDDDLMFSLEALDFGKNEFIGDTGMNLRFKTEYSIYNHILVSAGVDDMINTDTGPRYFLGWGIQFDDDDMKLLVTSVGGKVF